MQREKILWHGFNFIYNTTCGSDVGEHSITAECEAIRAACYSYFKDIDTSEFQLRVIINTSNEDYAYTIISELINNNLSRNKQIIIQLKDTETAHVKKKCILSHAKPGLSLSLTQWCIIYDVIVRNPIMVPVFRQVSFWHYSSTSFPDLHLVSREKPADIGVGARGLLSNELHGLDNTGNVRVWLAETMLLHTLLSRPDLLRSSTGQAVHRVLELGGGMTGLCGIGLYMHLMQSKLQSEPYACSGISVIITDGHPDCVTNQRACIAMQRSRRPNALRRYSQSCTSDTVSASTENIANIETGEDLWLGLTARQLRWSRGDVHGDLAGITATAAFPEDGRFDLVIAADCLFFSDFHEDLLWTLSHALRENGVVLLLQPRRSGTMHAFVQKAQVDGFEVEEIANFNAAASVLHEQYLAHEKAYDPDIHYPLLLRLTKRTAAFCRPEEVPMSIWP